MLSEEAQRLALQRIRLELRERVSPFSREIAQIKAYHASFGALQSSATGQAILDAIAREYEIRVFKSWGVLARVLDAETNEVDAATIARLQDIIEQELTAHEDDLKQQYATVYSNTPMPSWPALTDLRGPATAKVASEIEISVRAVNRGRMLGSGATLHFYQPVGVVQTGSHATATVSQMLDPAARAALTRALDVIETLSGPALPERTKAELAVVVRDARSELQSEKPNGPRLTGALLGLAATIQTLGSAKDAYLLLKAAATLIGIALP